MQHGFFDKVPRSLLVMALSSEVKQLKKPRVVSSSRRKLPSSYMLSLGDTDAPAMICHVTFLDHWTSFTPKYRLQLLIPDFESRFKKEKQTLDSKRQDEKATDEHIVNYAIIRSWLWEIYLCRGDKHDSVDTDTTVHPFLQLGPIFVSQDMRQDVVMYRNSIPLMAIEVHSSPYRCTLLKLSYVLVNQLR